MQAIDIINSVAKSLGDEENVTWGKSDLANYLAQAERAIVLVRPDAYSTESSIQLTEGSRQNLANVSGALRLIDVTRNMGNDGNTPGRPIRHVDRKTLDAFKTTWHSAAGSEVIKNFTVDERNPSTFFVSPPVPQGSTIYVEAVYSLAPPSITDPDNDAITLDDIYEAPIIEFMLYRAYSDESDSQLSPQLAAQHMNTFMSLLGVKTKSDVTFSPNQKISGNSQ